MGKLKYIGITLLKVVGVFGGLRVLKAVFIAVAAYYGQKHGIDILGTMTGLWQTYLDYLTSKGLYVPQPTSADLIIASLKSEKAALLDKVSALEAILGEQKRVTGEVASKGELGLQQEKVVQGYKF